MVLVLCHYPKPFVNSLAISPKYWGSNKWGAKNLFDWFLTYTKNDLFLTLAQNIIQSPAVMPKPCLNQYVKSVFCCVSNNLHLKFGFGLNNCKCTGHTSNKVDKISLDIIPTRIDFENLKINYPHY